MTREMNAQNNISLEEACQGHMTVAHQLLPPDRLRCTQRHTWCHTSRGLFGSNHHEKCFSHPCHFDTVAAQGSCSAGYDDGTYGHLRALTCTSRYLLWYVKNSRVRRWYIRKMADPATLIHLARSMRPKTFSGLHKDCPKRKCQLKTCMAIMIKTVAPTSTRLRPCRLRSRTWRNKR